MMLKTIFKKISFFPIILCSFACFLYCFNVQTKQASANNYDYSFSDEKYTLNSKDMFVKLVGEPNELETNYLNNLDYQLSYTPNVDKDNVVTSVIDNKLYVFAYESISIGNNEAMVKWVPDAFKYNNKTYNFVEEGDHYLGVAENYNPSIDAVEVNYIFNAEIDKDDADEIVNGAYYYAKEQSDIKDNQVNDYNNAKAAYHQYLLDLEAYNQNKIEWDTYEAENEAHNIYFNKYNDYLTKKENYEQNKAAWDQYNEDFAKYAKYLSDLAYYNENHEQNLIDYNNFYPNFQKFEYRLKAMNLIYKNMAPMNRNIYDQVMGDSVTQVLSNKSDLVALGVDKTIIDKAYTATLELRIIFEDYKSKETDEQRYSYYKNNYSIIKANVENLLRCLDKLYRSNLVPEAISSQGKDKTEKYLNLVAQLAYLANAIDDKDVYNYEGWNGLSGSLKPSGAKIIDDEWTLKGLTWRQYLEGEEFLDVSGETFKAYPSESKFPTEIVELLVEPEPVEEPVAPVEVLTEPVEPTPVDQPTQPSEKLNKPDAVSEPKLEDYLTSSEQDYAYAEAYKTAELVKHKDITENQFIKLECSASVSINSTLKKVCRFLNYDGSYLYQDFFNTYPKYVGNTPFREQDSTYNDYLFQDWDDLNDNCVNLETINESCQVKAHFLGRNLEQFNITFIIGDKSEVIACSVGYLPTLPKDISLPETNEHFYVFSGWDKELELVHKADVYTAQFIEKNKYLIEFDIDGTVTSQLEKEGDFPAIPSNIAKPDNGNKYYTFNGWDKEIAVVDSSAKYTAQFIEEEYINITWIVDGQSSIEKYKHNQTVNYKNGVPSKDNVDGYYFEFESWSIDLGFEATEDLTITAQFAQKRLVNVNWVIRDNVISRSFKENEEIVNPEVEPYFDDCYIYEFNGFEKQPNSTAYDIHYTAKYNKDYILYSHDASVRIHAYNNIINIYLDDRKDIDLSPLFELFGKGYEMGDIKIIGNSYNISISRVQLQSLINKGWHIISLDFNSLENKEYDFKVNILNEKGESIQDINNSVIKLELNGSFDALRSYAYIENVKQHAEITNETVILDVKPNTKYDVFPIYNVTILTYDGAEIKSSALSGRFGDEIVLEYILKPGYTFENFVVSETNGQICNTNEKYTIKGYDIMIGISVFKIKYTINWYVDDEIYATSYVFYGEQIVPPEYVSKLPTETTRYNFVRWDKNVTTAYQNEDFHAIFNEIEIPKPPKNNKVSVITIVEIVGGSVIGIGLIAVLLIIFRKKIFKLHK